MNQDQAQCAGAPIPKDFFVFPAGAEIRTRPEITTFFSLHSVRQVIIANHRDGTQSSLSIEELEGIVRYAKSERTRQKKEAEKANRQNIKYIQSL